MDSEENEDQKQDTSSRNGTMLEQASGQYEEISMSKSDSGVGGQPSPRVGICQETDVDTGAPVEQEQEVESEVTVTVQSPVDEEYYSITSEPKPSDQSYQSIDSEPFYSLPDKSLPFAEGKNKEESIYEEIKDDETDDLKKDADRDDEDEDDNFGSVSDEESFDDATGKLTKRSTDTDELVHGFKDDGSSVVSDIFTDVSVALDRLSTAYKSAISKEPKHDDHHGSRFDSLRSKYTRPRTYPPPREPRGVTGYQSLLPRRDYHPYASYQTSTPVTFNHQPELEYSPIPESAKYSSDSLQQEYVPSLKSGKSYSDSYPSEYSPSSELAYCYPDEDDESVSKLNTL